jgi:hypothetical protein
MSPHVEAGPAFRAVGASLAQHMSGKGLAAGIGLEFRIGPVRIGPELRYTHWGNDGVYTTTPYHAVSNRNQLEILAELGTAPAGSVGAPSRHAGWSNRVSLGVKGGLPFTPGFIADELDRVSYPATRCGNFSPAACTTINPTVQRNTASRNYLLGPTVEVHLPFSLSVEGDA